MQQLGLGFSATLASSGHCNIECGDISLNSTIKVIVETNSLKPARKIGARMFGTCFFPFPGMQ